MKRVINWFIQIVLTLLLPFSMVIVLGMVMYDKVQYRLHKRKQRKGESA